MKREIATYLASVILLAMPALPAVAQAPATDSTAAQMVSAQVALAQNLDAGKAKAGDQVRTTLSDKVTLRNGTVLPGGTTILGVVSTDEMQLTGTTKLALIFDKAVLKNGTTVPLKATIVGVFQPESEDSSGRPIKAGEEHTSAFSQRPDAVDEIGALPGVDLHSKITSGNSGVLVATGKRDFKLKWGSEISLAIVASTQQHQGE
jgi:hypothetical protein